MLTYFRADNFKSLVNVTVEPAGLNLLVGSNNAGKTNLCHALRFLSLTSRMSLQDAARRCTPEPWSLANVYLDRPTIDLALRSSLRWKGQNLDLDYELSLTAPRVGKSPRDNEPLAVRSETLRATGGEFNGTALVENRDGQVKLLHERVFMGQQPGHDKYVSTTAPPDHTMLFRLYDLETNQRANLFKRYLGDWQYFNFDALRLRNSTAQPLDVVLEADGSNLASVLFNLKSSDERLYRKVVEAAKTVLRGLRDRWCPDAQMVEGSFRGTTGLSLRRELRKICDDLFERKGCDVLVFLSDADEAAWRKLRRKEVAKLPEQVRVFAVYGIENLRESTAS
ncbi:MAG: hypothetical protein AB1486_17410 [Planctomycetota bacterium]